MFLYDPSLLATTNIENLYKKIHHNWNIATNPDKKYMFNKQHWNISKTITIES
jgi:hypothetical protein